MRRFYLSVLLLTSLLLSSNWLRAQTTTFGFTAGIQSYTVPAGVTMLSVEVAGGKGGNNNNWPSGTYPSQGGNGGRVVCSLAVTSGQVLTINVGGQGAAGIPGGSHAAGGYNGGGTAGSSGTYAGGGGGGATDISLGGTKVIVAGGGGGAGLDYPGGNRELGGAGGGLVGGAGYWSGSNTNLAGGQGGTQTAGGASGIGGGTPGSLGTGGDAYAPGGSGGGGGGYYGGGGGGSSWAAGGGGSSYTDAALATNVTHTQAANAGDGYAVITVPCTAPSITSTVSSVCPGSTISLTASPTGGTWSSGDATVSVGGTTGDVTGVSTGMATVTYTEAGGCTTTTTITVLDAPGTITGASSVCAGSTTTLSNSVSGGSWSSTNTGVAMIGSAAGDVTGVVAGTTTISYELSNGCATSSSFTVNPVPGTIGGTTAACEGLTSTLSNSVSGGTWSSDITGVASVNTTGDVLGVSAGTANITYTLLGGCFTSVSFTVNAIPAITGTTAVCVASSTTLSASEAGGTWMSSDATIATIGSAGDVLGVAAGTSDITYTTPEGCSNSLTMTVNPLPAVITGTANVCAGLSTTLSDATTGGTWSSSDVTVATAGTAGNITGVNAGTATIYYTLPTTCAAFVTFTTNALPAAFNVTGGGNYCANGSGMNVGVDGSETGVNYDLYIGGSLSTTLPGTGSSLDFGLQTAVANYTVVATNTTTGCVADMSGFVHVDTLPLPAVYNVTGGGAYCLGGAGVHVGLNNSNTGFNYQVYLGGVPVSAPFAGSGAALDFGLRTAAGVYKVISTNTATGCTNNMADSATVAINSLPVTYAVTGGGAYCAGGAGVHVMLSGSESGVDYQLYLGATAVGSPAAGTGTALDFGASIAAGSYSVVATNATTGCMNNMAGSATISINPLPTLYTVIGGGSYCEGGSGVHVELSGSDMGISYQLYLGTTPIGTAATGTGTTIDFGAVTDAGSYTAVATDTHTGCTAAMISAASVSVNPAPAGYTVGGGGSYCAGGAGLPVTLSGSNTGISYQLYDTVAVGTPEPGTGSGITFGTYTAAGAYTVIATNNTTGCTATMTGSATITITPLVTPTIIATNSGADTICAGTRVLYTAHATDGGTAPVIYWTVNGTTVATADTFSYVPVSADSVVVTLVSNAACATVDTVTDTTVMTITANQTPTVSISVDHDTVCSGTSVTFTAVNTFGGSAPAYTWVVNGSSVASSDTYSFTPANGDIVYATLNSNYRCLTSTAAVFSNNTTIAVDSVVIPSVTISGSAIVPSGHIDTLTAIATNGGTAPSYQWYINSSMIAGATSATLTHTFVNNDSVSVVVTRKDACHLSTFNAVKMQVYNLGIQSLGAGSFSVVPNPSNGAFSVRGAVNGGDAEATIEVVNMLGQAVYSGKAEIRNGQVDEQVKLGNIANGTYLLHISTSTGNSVFHLVIEQ